MDSRERTEMRANGESRGHRTSAKNAVGVEGETRKWPSCGVWCRGSGGLAFKRDLQEGDEGTRRERDLSAGGKYLHYCWLPRRKED